MTRHLVGARRQSVLGWLALLAILSSHVIPLVAAQSGDILRDPWSTPHVFAVSEADGFFGLGYAAALDRLLRMELIRRKVQYGSPYVLQRLKALLNDLGTQSSDPFQANPGRSQKRAESSRARLPTHPTTKLPDELAKWNDAAAILSFLRQQLISPSKKP